MLNIHNLCVDFGNRLLFNDVSLTLSKGERVALVGRNGAGKSTFLKLVAKIEQPSSGTIAQPQDIRIGYLPQVMHLKDDRKVYAEVEQAFDHISRLKKRAEELTRQMQERTDYESASYAELIEAFATVNDTLSIVHSGGNYHAQIERTLLGLGFDRDDFNRPTSSFSGGWRMRIELAKILLARPDLLLLDEPTNHLDIESIRWLEQFILQSKSALILVSHDRTFVDAATSRTIEIERGRIYDYKTNYSHYLTLREERLEQQQRAYENQQKAIKETEGFIEQFRYKASKAVQVQSRIKQLEKIQRIEPDEIDRRAMHLRFRPAQQSGAYPVLIDGLSKAFGERKVLHEINLTVERGERIAFVGKNGCGKTTLVRCITGELNDYTGKLNLGHQVAVAYFAQDEADRLDPTLTVYETIDRVAEGEVRLQINNMLGAFLFGGEESEKRVGVLSGGERSRLALLRLLLRPANLLIFDEPTNHLDFRSKDVLKEAISRFDGTVILVSHDRDFLDGLVEKVYAFSNGSIREYMGGIHAYLNETAVQGREEEIPAQPSAAGSPPSAGAEDYRRQKDAQAKRRSIEREIHTLETQIERLESDLAAIEKRMASDENLDDEVFSKYAEQKEQLEFCMGKWEEQAYNLETLTL